MLRKILIGLIVLIAAFLIIVALRPNDYHVSRTTTIAAPPTIAFAQINDLRQYAIWNPWGKIDPAMKTTFKGPSTGVGSTLAWTGDNRVGEGRMTITESQPNERVRIRLEFLKPFASVATTEFTFKPVGEQTEVTWAMFGEQGFMHKAIGLFMSMDKMIGPQFEQGLDDMKALAESKR